MLFDNCHLQRKYDINHLLHNCAFSTSCRSVSYLQQHGNSKEIKMIANLIITAHQPVSYLNTNGKRTSRHHLTDISGKEVLSFQVRALKVSQCHSAHYSRSDKTLQSKIPQLLQIQHQLINNECAKFFGLAWNQLAYT